MGVAFDLDSLLAQEENKKYQSVEKMCKNMTVVH